MKAKLYVSRLNLVENIEKIQKIIGEGHKIIAMVKANAYGIGDTNVVSILDEIGITDYGVANSQEAIRVRNISPNSNILITSVSTGEEIVDCINNNISMSVSDIDNIVEINNYALTLGKIAKIQFKIDTGMTRLGFTENIVEKIDEILSLSNIHIQGIYTHLSCADMDEEYTKEQINTFNSIVTKLSEKVNFEFVHFLNSDGTMRYADSNVNYTHVRVGIMMYGYAEGMKPVSKLTAPILHVNDITKYTKVGYGGTFIAKPNMKIAVAKIGYADGISRCLSNRLRVHVNGVECEAVGNICMDLFMIDVTNANCKVGDEVVLWDYSNDLKEIASISNKITYEVISNLGDRIERVIE